MDLSGANLSNANLGFAQLPGAQLGNAVLDKANLHAGNLKGANLNFAYLGSANLKEVSLVEADLKETYLDETNLSHATLSRANLSRAFSLKADLSYAVLSGASLDKALLEGANLSHANLYGAQLNGADLTKANMYGAQGITNEEVKAQAASLGGATMPTGQKITLTLEQSLKPPQMYLDDPPPVEYVTDEVFEPAFRFTAGYAVAGGYEYPWIVDSQKVSPETDEADALVFRIESWPEPEGGRLTFTRPVHVFDPSNPSEPTEVPAPEHADEWVSWFQRHPNLETSKPVPVSVGDASGMRIDVTATSTPENYPRDDCVQPCVFLYPSSLGSILIYEETKERYIIVDVKGETVVINVGTGPDKFDEFLPEAQKILDTVEWREGG